MDMNRIKYRLRSTESQTSVNTDTFVNIELKGNERLLPYNDINRIVDAGEVFNNERQSATKYRIIGTIKPIISNVLFNIDGNDSWVTLTSPQFLDDPYDNPDTGREPITWSESYTTNLRERDGWFGYYDPNFVASGSCDFIDMNPKREKFSFKPDVNGIKRWELTVTYPWSADTTHDLIWDNIGGISGLRIVGVDTAKVGGRNLVLFSTALMHNLAQGDRVRIRGLSDSTLDNDYRVIRVGTDNGDLKEYTFSVLIDYVPPSLLPPISPLQTPPIIATNSALGITDTRMNRLIGGQESEYYFRLFKKVRTVNTNINNGVLENDDYEIYPTAFASTVYRDEVCQFVINEDVETKDLVDNLGRPLSELYLTTVKTRDFVNVNNPTFTPIKVGVEIGLVEGYDDINIPDIRRLHENVGSLNVNPQENPFLSPLPLTTNVTINDNYFYGDAVDYNRFELIEYTIGRIGHRFNTTNRSRIHNPQTYNLPKGPRLEGYFYYPHHLMKIRDFSNYVEQGDTNTYGIPDYAEDLGDGRWLWRDLLDIGLNDGQYKTLNYPFLNGAHYLYHNFCLPVRRQDPFGQYGLLYYYREDGNGNRITFSPYDVIGTGTSDRFKVNSEDDAC